MFTRKTLIFAAIIGLTLAAAGWSINTPADPDAGAQESSQTVVVNITSGRDDLLTVSAGIQAAFDAHAAGRSVIVLFSVDGVTLPTRFLRGDLRYDPWERDQRTIQQRLRNLDDLPNATLLVCRDSLEAKSLVRSDLNITVGVVQMRTVFTHHAKDAMVLTY